MIIQSQDASCSPFVNYTQMCIGTGRLSLALQTEYVSQLRLVQEKCHFRYIRGHGLFCDDLGIYQEIRMGDHTEVRYNFTYLDRVMDTYVSLGLKPFLELGFMPSALAKGTQTIFYYKANTTPPKDPQAWASLVFHTLEHLSERYGEDEVRTWPAEVWNEPNLPGFWENADLQAYLDLYKVTSLTVKRAVPGMAVGGPAVCGGNGCDTWIDTFLTYCEKEHLPVDFISRHLYMAQTPEVKGRYTYHKMCQVSQSLEELRKTREVIASHPEHAHLPLYITEFNTSYNPFCPVHDTVMNAAFTAGLLAQLGDYAQLFSYWTFGDVFEEQGIPRTPFHGGFGLTAANCIPKPTFWTFVFFSHLKGDLVFRDEHLLCLRQGETVMGVFWNICQEKAKSFSAPVKVPAQSRMCLLIESVNTKYGNPLKVWQDMGMPDTLNAEQTEWLRQAAHPCVSTCVLEPKDGYVFFRLSSSDHAVTAFRLFPFRSQADVGYESTWYR